ncbi:MAG: hypothetical protein A2340_06660 [Lentisphaerae bacterium RIFOXYB12_FULL_60_10]|nr:MAG: hypothetical protein A2340_06660 [Lentisphaerae bacterium RIFOXYB12_FULL_60_10]
MTPPPVSPAVSRPLPQPNAHEVMTRGQRNIAIFGLLVALLLLWQFPRQLLVAVNVAVIVCYLLFAGYKLILQMVSVRARHTDQAPGTMDRNILPRYTVLVPLYHEASAAPGLVAHLKTMEYPMDRLRILLLVEADDDDTRTALDRLVLEPPFEVITVPVSMPRTKPKACNIGLDAADGDLLVIYDAEDRPEPDQLLKAAWKFQTSPGSVVCLQSALNFYNTDRNLLTRWFTIEYSGWFDQCLPGLFHLDAPIPLGGTSNHFRLAPLQALGGWDPYNVTEDCDLGIRLYICGYRTAMLDSTTWEEATFRPGPWIRQRSRWIKGYIQTYLVHLRQHGRLLRTMGPVRTLHFHFLFGATFFCLLVNPVYWLMTLLWLTTTPAWLNLLFPAWLMVPALLSFLAGNAAFVLSSMLACLNRQTDRLVPVALLMPLYWILMSIGAWKGAIQLVTRPFYWEKTPHEAKSAWRKPS